MSTGFILINAALAIGVVLMIAGGITWAIATQHRDHGVAAAGSLFRRRLWSHRRTRSFNGFAPQPNPAF